jgi:hypothetical protein
MKNETTDQNFDRCLALAICIKVPTHYLLAEGHTKWPTITSTENAALKYFKTNNITLAWKEMNARYVPKVHIHAYSNNFQRH